MHPRRWGSLSPQLPINAYSIFLAGAGHQDCVAEGEFQVAEAEFQVRVDKRDFWAIMGYFLRTLQLLSTCVAISLVGSLDSWTVPTSTWSFVILCFCFVVTFIILIIESLALHYCFPFSWGDFLLCHACYLALFCLLVSIIYPTTYVQFLFYTPSWDHAIAATAFCFISTVSYATEAIWILGWPQTGDFTGYTGSLPFLLKMLETLVACVILPFISNPYLYMDHPLLGPASRLETPPNTTVSLNSQRLPEKLPEVTGTSRG